MTFEEEKEALIEDIIKEADEFVERAIKREKQGNLMKKVISFLTLIPVATMIRITLQYLPLFQVQSSSDSIKLYFDEIIRPISAIGFGIIVLNFIDYYFSSNKSIDHFIDQAKDEKQREIRINLIGCILERKLTEKEEV